MFIIKNPDRELKRRWGALAHVEESERQRILELPAGEAKLAVQMITHRLKQMAKKNSVYE